jgi:hypothetical protein
MSASSSPGPADAEPVAPLLEIAHRPTLGRRLISWASRPPGRLYLPACAVTAGMLAFSASLPGWHVVTFVLGVLAGGFLAAMGALRLGIALTVARPMIRRYWLRWITAPLIATGLAVVLLTELPLQLRVAASDAALQELGAELQEDGSIPLEGQRAGLFRLESATVNGDGTVRFTPAAQGVFADRGIAYAPEGLVQGVFLPGHGNLVYHHLHGPWYEWTSY